MTCHVYLIHLDKSIHHANHYLGYSALENVSDRLKRHQSGNGSKLLSHANHLGIGYRIVRLWTCSTWKQARDLERKLKSRHNSTKLCPICNPKMREFLVNESDLEGGINGNCNKIPEIPF